MRKISILLIPAVVFMITSCSKGRGYITSEEGGVVGVEINMPVGKEKAELEEKKEVTFEQKKEIAKQVGIILPGMTKQEVVKTLGEPRKIEISVRTELEV